MSKQKDGQPRGKYTMEFRLEAVRLVKGGQAAAVTVGAWSLRRYLMILQLAEFLGDRSTCPKCHAYARFKLLYTGPRDEPGLPQHLLDTPVLAAQCRKCGASWHM